jgi:hypothetical protein
MSLFSPKLPVCDDDRLWVDAGFNRLQKLLGRRRMLEAKVVLPTAEDFPDHYDNSFIAAEKLFCRVCAYMEVDSTPIELEVFADETEELREILPYWQGNDGTCAAGLYVDGRTGDDEGDKAISGEKRVVVAIRSTQLKDPLSLIATIAHELGHVILLGGRLIDIRTEDHEPLTDLLTVFLGLGIFTANSSSRFRQYQDDRRQGWSMQRLGYLPEEVYGYALAKFAAERLEDQPEWVKYLSTNVRSYFKNSHAWLKKNRPKFGTVTAGDSGQL